MRFSQKPIRFFARANGFNLTFKDFIYKIN